jgi:hypothetical protein
MTRPQKRPLELLDADRQPDAEYELVTVEVWQYGAPRRIDMPKWAAMYLLESRICAREARQEAESAFARGFSAAVGLGIVGFAWAGREPLLGVAGAALAVLARFGPSIGRWWRSR